MPRKYTRIKIQEERIIEMRKAGKTRQEIADELGMGKRAIKNWISRYNRREAEKEASPIKGRGRKAAVTIQEYKYENKRLKMENELLRDFLRLAGRK
jgi:transposase